MLLLADSGLAAAPASKAPKLEGMAYDKARALILGYGWKPFPRGCGWPEESVCARYPELGVCQMVSPGACGMTFSKGNRCLFIATLESPPGTSRDGTWVTDVTFRREPCPKDTN
jgi:hypothetical protein